MLNGVREVYRKGGEAHVVTNLALFVLHRRVRPQALSR